MNTALLTAVVNPELRSETMLKHSVVENTSSGTPWLTEE